jgi:hypothetical protein
MGADGQWKYIPVVQTAPSSETASWPSTPSHEETTTAPTDAPKPLPKKATKKTIQTAPERDAYERSWQVTRGGRELAEFKRIQQVQRTEEEEQKEQMEQYKQEQKRKQYEREIIEATRKYQQEKQQPKRQQNESEMDTDEPATVRSVTSQITTQVANAMSELIREMREAMARNFRVRTWDETRKRYVYSGETGPKPDLDEEMVAMEEIQSRTTPSVLLPPPHTALSTSAWEPPLGFVTPGTEQYRLLRRTGVQQDEQRNEQRLYESYRNMVLYSIREELFPSTGNGNTASDVIHPGLQRRREIFAPLMKRIEDAGLRRTPNGFRNSTLRARPT